MDQQTYIIRLDGVSVAEANRYTLELRDILLDTSSDVSVRQRKENPSTQDFGSTLTLVLGTPAVIAVVRAIGDWLKIRHSVSLTIEKEGRVIAQNITSKDALRLAELFLANK